MLNVEYERKRETGSYHLIMSHDGTRLFLREWSNNHTNSDYAILIFHGITAYSKPYFKLARPLVNAGYEVYGLDLRGHGLSEGERGDMPSKHVLLDDLTSVIDFLQKVKKKQVILLGHSLGVLTAMILLNAFANKVKGLILLSFARKIKPSTLKEPDLKFKLKFVLYSILNPGKPLIRYYREGIKGLDDPLATFWYTPRFIKIYNPEKIFFPEDLNVPVFYGIGGKDELFDLSDAMAFFNEIPVEDKEFHVYANATHTEFPQVALNLLVNWLKRKFPVLPSSPLINLDTLK